MKAIILAGGEGSRLYPLTRVASKQLQAIYDKPMIYYPLTVLMASGIRSVCVITTAHDMPRFQNLLGDGSQWGVSIEFRVQPKPAGIAQAFLIAEDFIGSDSITLMLGDNIFLGGDVFPRAMQEFSSGATIFAYHVTNPSEYGVVSFDHDGMALSIEEKPANPQSNYAVPGMYIYDNNVIGYAKGLKPSHRGELEITDINCAYMAAGQLQVRRISRGTAWLDAGTSRALQEASEFVAMIERRQGVKFGCPEEAALVRGFLSLDKFSALIGTMPNCEYRTYLTSVLHETERLMRHDDPHHRPSETIR